MREAASLGLRLALRGGARLRSAGVFMAAMVGTTLAVTGLALSSAAGGPGALGVSDQALSAGLRLAILLPVGVLAFMVGRLSSAVREQRAARLHMLGLTPVQVRVVAAVEAGAVGLAGWLLGVLGAFAVLWVPRGGSASVGADVLPTAGQLVVSFVVVPLVVALSAASIGLGGRRFLATARGATASMSGWGRLAFMLVSLGAVAYARHVVGQTPMPAHAPVVVVASVALLALSGVLILPTLARVFALCLMSIRKPAATVAGRRLLAQPAAQTRTLSALLVALFLAAVAQGVAAAIESIPQYQYPTYHGNVEASVLARIPAGEPMAQTMARATSLPGFRDAVGVTTLLAECPPGMPCELPVLLSTCEELTRMLPGVAGCSDEHASAFSELGETAPTSAVLHTARPDGRPANRIAEVPIEGTITVPTEVNDRTSALLFVPRSMVNASIQPDHLLILADPQMGLMHAVLAAGFDGATGWDDSEYASLSRIVDGSRLVTLIILGVGLVGCAVGAVDRAMERRREVIRLQLVGIPRRVLLFSHWLEVGVPLVVGTVLSLSLGWLAADTYAGFAIDPQWTESATLGWFLGPLTIAALAGSVIITAATSLAASPRIHADLIRAA